MAGLSLEIVEGLGAGRLVAVPAPVEIGRGPDAGLRLDDPLVSRAHVGVSPDRGGLTVHDLGSRNGTFADGAQVHDTTRLEPGGRLLVGATVLELRTAEQIASRPSAAVPVPERLTSPAATAPTGTDGLEPLPRAGRPAGLIPLGIAMVLTLVVLLLLSR
jgi:pSer/pThr/pTyr-binding forkhead associated (FHA) protein